MQKRGLFLGVLSRRFQIMVPRESQMGVGPVLLPEQNMLNRKVVRWSKSRDLTFDIENK